MITALLVVFVITVLVATMFYNSRRVRPPLDEPLLGTVGPRRRVRCQHAIGDASEHRGIAPADTVTATTAEGTYQFRVTAKARNRYQIDSAGTVGPGIPSRPASVAGHDGPAVVVPVRAVLALRCHHEEQQRGLRRHLGEHVRGRVQERLGADCRRSRLRGEGHGRFRERQCRHRPRHPRAQLSSRRRCVDGRQRFVGVSPGEQRHDRRVRDIVVEHPRVCRRSRPLALHRRRWLDGRQRHDLGGGDRRFQGARR